MNRLLHVASLLAIVLSFCGLPGCNETPAAPGPPKIVAGTPREVVTEIVPSTGGTVTVDLPGDSLDGFVIDVPDGAYGNARTFHVSESPIENHELGPDFNPLTPLITIENGGGYSESPMKVTIPCTIPDGHFAMAFVYDRATGRIEGVPTVAMDDGSITILTSNFDFSSVASLAKRSMLNGGAVQVGNSEIVVSSIPEAKLNQPYDSDFRPGVDDWQFPNCGSYVYLGHCGGQSAAMMWYFSDRKQKRGDEPLYGRFDNDGARITPKIWQDDVAGYRFCGFAQATLPWGTISHDVQMALESLSEKLTYNLFAYAIRITKQPQFVYIVPESGSTDSSHAMVVYKVENEKIYIADPNYPGKTDRFTEFSLGHFLPYYSGTNAQSAGIKYTNFRYLAQSSIVNTKGLNDEWPRVFDGSVAGNLYPKYTITARDESGSMSSLTDGFVTKSGILELDVRNSDVPLKVWAVYRENETAMPFSNNLIRLQFGEHLLGFYVTDMKGNWVGFEWIRVTAKADATEPIDIPPSETEKDCTSHLVIDGTGMPVTFTEYNIYPNGTFQYLGDFPSGSVCMTIKGFAGPGTYQLYRTETIAEGGSFFALWNGNWWPGDGTMTITRYDSEKTEGTFTFENKNIQGEIVKKVTGQFYCNR